MKKEFEKSIIQKIEEKDALERNYKDDEYLNEKRAVFVAKRLGWLNENLGDKTSIKLLNEVASKKKINFDECIKTLSKICYFYCKTEFPRCYKCPINHFCTFYSHEKFREKLNYSLR